MKKSLLLIFVLSLLVSLPASSQSKKEQKKAEREAQVRIMKENIKNAIADKNFTFLATELTSAPNIGITSIRLNSSYGVYVTPESIKCYLPVYGSGRPTSPPSVVRRLEFFLYEYDMEVKPDYGEQGWEVTIKVNETRSINTYTFVFYITPTGENSTLRLSTNFSSPATFKGYIRNDN